jgi:DNA-binding response OmpR family regulator
MSKILIIEDEEALVAALSRGLVAEGYSVDTCTNGKEGYYFASENSYDLILLDILLPEMNGFEICEELRRIGVITPILMLTAQSDDLDVAEGLDLGADDYLIKPFSFVVLLSRIRSLIRRSKRISAEKTLVRGPFVLDPDAHRAFCHDVELNLTAKEFSILTYFLLNSQSVISKRELLDELWDMNYDGDPNIVEVYIRRLRQKLDPILPFTAIQTIRGVGYRMNLEQT